MINFRLSFLFCVIKKESKYLVIRTKKGLPKMKIAWTRCLTYALGQLKHLLINTNIESSLFQFYRRIMSYMVRQRVPHRQPRSSPVQYATGYTRHFGGNVREKTLSQILIFTISQLYYNKDNFLIGLFVARIRRINERSKHVLTFTQLQCQLFYFVTECRNVLIIFAITH